MCLWKHSQIHSLAHCYTCKLAHIVISSCLSSAILGIETSTVIDSKSWNHSEKTSISVRVREFQHLVSWYRKSFYISRLSSSFGLPLHSAYSFYYGQPLPSYLILRTCYSKVDLSEGYPHVADSKFSAVSISVVKLVNSK